MQCSVNTVMLFGRRESNAVGAVDGLMDGSTTSSMIIK